MKPLWPLAVPLIAAVTACSTVREEGPTSPLDEARAASLIPDPPTPTPSPTPGELDPLLPNPGGGAGAGDVGGSCGAPTPPPFTRVNVGVLHVQASRVVLNATPLVGPDADYCRLAGFTDGRLFCPVRPEGDPERAACEALRVGRATDTGRLGPTWTANGSACGGGGAGSCQNHPDNQFLALAFGDGTFRACVAGGVCGSRTIP